MNDIIDFEEERSRHGRIFGREDVLAKLGGWLSGPSALSRGWVLLLGSPGVGKSAILTRALDTLMDRETPHHFIRRGNEGWDRPEVVVQNLCAQIERLFTEQANPELPSGARLGDLLKRVSRSTLVPRGRRLVVVIDGLDEAAGDGDNPLQRFLPCALPASVVIVCASRPIYPHLDWLTQQDHVRRIDLDDALWAVSNEAACRAFWEHRAPELTPPLAAAFVEEAVRRAKGNLLHAIRLSDWLEDLPPSERVAKNIPQGLSGFLTQIWARLHTLDEARRDLVMKGLGVACAAREALPAYLFNELIGSSGTGEGEDFLRATRPFLLEEPAHWHGNQPAYRPYHEHFREFIAGRLGEPVIRAHHASFTKTLAAWPHDGPDPGRRAYALRHAVTHRIEAGDVAGARSLCVDVGYLEAKCKAAGGVASIERDIEATLRVTSGDLALDLAAILAAVSAEAARLRESPESLPVLLYNRLRCAGWPAKRIDEVLRFDGGRPRLRLSHGVRLGPVLLRTFLGHAREIVASVSTPDGSHVLTASTDRTLRLWSLGSGECIATLGGHDDEITSCAVAPDGDTAVSASVDGTVKVWSLSARRCVDTLDNAGRWATACAITPDGRSVVVGSDDGSIAIWDLVSRRRAGRLLGHGDYVTACLPTGGGLLVSASRDGTARVWSLASAGCKHALQVGLATGPVEARWVTALSLLPSTGHVVVAAGDRSISRWDLAKGTCLQRFVQPSDDDRRVDVCAMLHDGRHLICGMADGAITVWDMSLERRVLRLQAHSGAVSTCAVAPDGRRLLTASHDRSMKLWELGGPESLMSQDGHTAPVTACAITPDGRTAVSASEDRKLKVWDVASGACRLTREIHDDLVTACAISPDGRRVLSGARDGSVRLWSLDRDEPEIAELNGARINGCAITPGEQLITASQDGLLVARGPRSLRRPETIGTHEGSIDGFSMTPDGAWALSFSRAGTVELWDVAARRPVHALHGIPSIVASVLAPDGRRAVLALADGRLELYDLVAGKRVRLLHEHSGRVFGCAISPDGARVVSASEDSTLRVFDLESGRLLGSMRGTSWFRCVAVAKGLVCAGDQEGNLWMVIDETGGSNLPGDIPPEESGRLRDRLATLYGAWEAARALAWEAGLDERHIDPSGSPIAFWTSIMREAIKQGCLDRMVRSARRSYPNDSVVEEFARRLGLT